MNESTPQSPRTIPHRGKLQIQQIRKEALPLLRNYLPLLPILLKHWRKQ